MSTQPSYWLLVFCRDKWTAETLEAGLSVKLKEIPFHVQLFKLVAPNGDIEWVITNYPPGTFSKPYIQDENAVRWQIEQLHRELKQLTGSEKCECRKARSQRNHLACCYHAWLSLKVKAQQFGKSLYCRTTRFIERLFAGRVTLTTHFCLWHQLKRKSYLN